MSAMTWNSENQPGTLPGGYPPPPNPDAIWPPPAQPAYGYGQPPYGVALLAFLAAFAFASLLVPHHSSPY
jgi:hypothetical protein